MGIKLFDSHAHYYDPRFEQAYDGGAESLLPAVFAGDVGWIVNVGTNNENTDVCVRQAARYPGMYAAIGIHPTDCQAYTDVTREIDRLAGRLAARRAEKVVAIGEIGLDYHYDDTDKPKQTAFFDAQMALAEELDLPVIIHDRDAHGDTLDMIRAHPRVTGILHSFSGSREMASELLRRGWYLSFSGVVTFKNAARVQEVAASVPLERLLLETDCPYLAPHPHRGEVNHSGLMHYTLETQAHLHGVSSDEAAEQTTRNACAVYRIPLTEKN